MSIKNLFGKKSDKLLPQITPEELGKEIESVDVLDSLKTEKEKFIPEIDFSDPSQFARFGSATKYYSDSIKSIIKTYPYDGSRNEKTEWHNSSSLLTNYIFNNLYPKNTGYINFGLNYGFEQTFEGEYSECSNYEYIFIKGGPNTFSETEPSKNLFGKSNYYNETYKRTSNLNLNGNDGVTVEFYLKKNDTSGSFKQVVFDLWNSASLESNEYGRFRIELAPGISGSENSIFITMNSGTYGITGLELTGCSIIDSAWHHYAVSAINQDNQILFCLYQDGNLVSNTITGSSIQQVYGPMLATIGCLVSEHAPGDAGFAWGKLSGSLDEFRYWKTARTDKDIQRYYFTEVYGGTNTDDANTDLGVYFKFNEGIFNNSDPTNLYDRNIIDYSGRISNATWFGYSTNSRSTGSALIESGFTQEEPPDPILYPNHPHILLLVEQLNKKTISYDQLNNSSIYNSFASWILDEDQQNGESLLELTQIMSEFFDEFYFYIKSLPELTDQTYKQINQLPFAKKLVESYGLSTLELFADSTILEAYLSRNEQDVFEQKIHDIKNLIYQNIYNNLLYIYRSKGTEKSIRNLLRCFGIDTELVKLNLYADDEKHTFEERYEYTSQKRKYINFNGPDKFEGTVYQVTQSYSYTYPFVRGKEDLRYLGNTLEVEIIFPRKFENNEDFYFETPFLSSSLFGMHEPNSFVDNMTWKTPDHASIQFFAVRPEKESKDACFVLSSSHFGLELKTPIFKDLYTDQKWLLSYRIRHEKYPYAGSVLGADDGDYIVEFRGFNTVMDIIKDEFIVSASIPKLIGEEYFNSSKKIYLGSHRQNFTGSVIVGQDNLPHLCDVQIGPTRFWISYLNDDVLRSHAIDMTLHGPESMSENVLNFLEHELKDKTIPEYETLAVYWNFDLIETSDNGSGSPISNLNDAGFDILDMSSGSFEPSTRYGILSEVTRQVHPARADFFLRNDTSVVTKEFVANAKVRLPEILNNDDLVNIVNRDDEVYTRDTFPINHYFSVEKSMYQNISEEILRWIGTIKQFNNLIGQPTYRYEASYKQLDFLRRLFFENIDNVPDFEKFVEFFKWIDQSVGKIIGELIPASMKTITITSNVLESHILERNKYRHKLPTIEFKGKDPIVAVRTINELKYNWKFGHAPIPLDEADNCLWWKIREEKEGAREKIFSVLKNTFERKLTTVYDLNIEPIVVIDKNPKEYDLVINRTSFGTQDFLEFDINLVVNKKKCDDL